VTANARGQLGGPFLVGSEDENGDGTETAEIGAMCSPDESRRSIVAYPTYLLKKSTSWTAKPGKNEKSGP